MILNRRRYEIVPFVERNVEDDLSGEPVEERLIHFPFGFIHLVNNFCKYFQTLLCHGTCRPAACIGGGKERCAVPGTCYLGEKTVFDGIELGAVRRLMRYDYLETNSFRKHHKILFHNVVRTGVESTAATEYHQHSGIWVDCAQTLSSRLQCCRTRTRMCHDWCLSRDNPCCEPCRRCRAGQWFRRKKSRSRDRTP